MRGEQRVVDVTAMAQRIFGDIVVSALQTLHPGYMGNDVGDDVRIDLKYGEVVIEFVTGRRVSIYTSEWGEIQEAM
jgi:hypothetical protein